MEVTQHLPAPVSPKRSLPRTPWLHALLHRLQSAPPSSPGLLDRRALALRATEVGALLRARGLGAGQSCLIVDEAPGFTLAAVLGAWLVGARPAVHASTMASGGSEALLASLQRLRGLLGGPCPVLVPMAVAAGAPGLDFLLGVPDSSDVTPLPSDRWHIPKPSELAYFQLSSGTTGSSKAIAIRWSAFMAQLDVLENVTCRARRLASWLPLNHDFGFTFILAALCRYDALALTRPADFMADPLGWLRSVASMRADHVLMPPFALSYVLRRVEAGALAALDLRSVQQIHVGGESVHPGEAARFLAALAPAGLGRRSIVVGYGLGEATCATHLCDADGTPVAQITRGPFTPGSAVHLRGVHTLGALPELPATELFVSSVGRPGRRVRCWLVDSEGAPVDEERRFGEVVIDGPMLADGYLRAPGTIELLPRGGVRTGDVGFHHEGQLYLVDRRGNLIIRRGCNYLARELETQVARAFGVHHGRVLVVDTDLQDPESELVVVLQHEGPLDRAETAARMAELDLPVPISAVYRLAARTHTRTSCGKKRYAWLRHLIATGELRPEFTLSLGSRSVDVDRASAEATGRFTRSPGSRSVAVDRALAEALAGLGCAAARPEDRLREGLGLDSLTQVELMSALASKLGVTLTVDALVAARTVAELRALLVQAPVGDGERFEQTVHARVLAEIPQMLVDVDEQRGRSLRVEGRWVEDFASCNYLAMDLDEQVMASVGPAIARWGAHPSWTRAVASPAIYRELERALAELVDAPDVLCFPTITLLHAGVLPVLCGAGALLVDTAAHASIQ
ncbi:MAG: AMP-binding protein, partial [Myxococcales bacterium]|nr:AMP-binding protein [Myxococcales bacterium]